MEELLEWCISERNKTYEEAKHSHSPINVNQAFGQHEAYRKVIMKIQEIQLKRKKRPLTTLQTDTKTPTV